MALFTSDILVTSDLDLTRYLRKYSKAYNLIEKGKFIVNYDKLLSLSTMYKKKRKYAIVVNTLHSSQKGMTGHWSVLLVEKVSTSGKCVYIDSLVSTPSRLGNRIAYGPRCHKSRSLCQLFLLPKIYRKYFLHLFLCSTSIWVFIFKPITVILPEIM